METMSIRIRSLRTISGTLVLAVALGCSDPASINAKNDVPGAIVVTDEHGDKIVAEGEAESKSIHVSKVSPAGQIRWTATLTGTGDNRLSSVVLTSDNKILITGLFTRDLTLADKTIVRSAVSDALASAIFMVKLRLDGTTEWFKPIAHATAVEQVFVSEADNGRAVLSVTMLGLLHLNDGELDVQGGRTIVVIEVDEFGKPTPLYSPIKEQIDWWQCIEIVCFFFPYCCDCCWDQSCSNFAAAFCGW